MIKHKSELHNAHVVLYYRFMHWISERQGKSFAQLYYYTMLNKEIYPEWQPEHLIVR